MPTLSIEDANVNVGETSVGAVEVGEVWIGEIERDVDVDVTPQTFLDFCDDEDRVELLNLLNEENFLIDNWFEHVVSSDEVKEYIEALTTILGGPVPQQEEPTIQTEEDRERLRQEATQRLEEVAEIPPVDVIRLMRTVSLIEPKHVRAFPLGVIHELLQKLGGEPAKPIVVYQIPPDLKTMIQHMEPGEVTESFVNELKTQIG